MNNRIRNRLIGILTILLMIIIVFPYIIKENAFRPNPFISLMTQKEADYQDFIINSQPTEGYIPNLESAYVPPAMIASPYSDSDTTNNNSVTDPNIAIIKSQTTVNKIYYIQLAALKNKQKIEELIALLRLHNYDVFVDKQDRENERLYRLFVGPYSSKEQTELAVLDLKNLTKLDGFIHSR
ncbi:MAG: SPOR domain-containing protein [Candidatus Schmidhempelia sp.]|nr:SPOR domain-containing protein [Candidatus Schmidhempelia sp.]